MRYICLDCGQGFQDGVYVIKLHSGELLLLTASGDIYQLILEKANVTIKKAPVVVATKF